MRQHQCSQEPDDQQCGSDRPGQRDCHGCDRRYFDQHRPQRHGLTSGDDITLTGNVDLDSTGTLTITGGGVAGEDITITGTIDDTTSNSDLVIVAALGAVNLQGNAGSTSALKSLTISSAALTDLANVIATGVIAVTSTNIDLNGTVYTSGDDITLTVMSISTRPVR